MASAQELKKAFEKIRATKSLSAEFAVDPEGALKRAGLETTGLRVGPMVAVGKKPLPIELHEMRRINPRTGAAGTAATVCGSVGGGGIVAVCGSVG